MKSDSDRSWPSLGYNSTRATSSYAPGPKGRGFACSQPNETLRLAARQSVGRVSGESTSAVACVGVRPIIANTPRHMNK